ncbi:hypothetical protein B9Z55_011780 [Caenorhabditis nigoni]|uniref:Uncharacterized protein n=1 Tax=Caenorhabditis nigoni TaxID=1611254 RepID=A0A2G5ULP9_9PELO|nr:hypothetical protein B9Z55_011780 [Caenorhabditis nigoni]
MPVILENITRNEAQQFLEDYDASRAFTFEHVRVQRVMIEVFKLKGRLSDLTKEQRIRCYQIINHHLEELLKDPEPVVDYSNMSINELSEHYELIPEREAQLKELRAVKGGIYRAWGYRWIDITDFIEFKKNVIYNYDLVCTYAKTTVTGFLTTMKNMIWKNEEEDVDRDLIIFV